MIRKVQTIKDDLDIGKYHQGKGTVQKKNIYQKHRNRKRAQEWVRIFIIYRGCLRILELGGKLLSYISRMCDTLKPLRTIAPRSAQGDLAKWAVVCEWNAISYREWFTSNRRSIYWLMTIFVNYITRHLHADYAGVESPRSVASRA